MGGLTVALYGQVRSQELPAPEWGAARNHCFRHCPSGPSPAIKPSCPPAPVCTSVFSSLSSHLPLDFASHPSARPPLDCKCAHCRSFRAFASHRCRHPSFARDRHLGRHTISAVATWTKAETEQSVPLPAQFPNSQFHIYLLASVALTLLTNLAVRSVGLFDFRKFGVPPHTALIPDTMATKDLPTHLSSNAGFGKHHGKTQSHMVSSEQTGCILVFVSLFY